VKFDGSVLALIPVTENKAGVEGGGDTEMVDGLLLKASITGGVTTGGVTTCGVGFVVWTGNVKQPGMTNSNNSSDSVIKTNFFNVVTS